MTFSARTGDITVFQDTGDISSVVSAFQEALGEPNNGNAAGPIEEGRRQINWDANIVPFDMPGDFFNKTVTRGAELTTPETSEFRVSNPDPTDPGAPDNRFDSINPTYADQFQTFSDFRLFTPADSNITEINFFVSGTDIPATVNGFGAIFTDVDLVGSTKIEYFDIEGNLLLSEDVGVDPQGLSFLGATFDDQDLYKVQITSGNEIIGPDDDPANGVDIVVMDDFLYGEPQVVDPILGSEDNDVLTGTPDGDFVQALGGDDSVLLFGGNDFADGGKGNDVISAGDGEDIIQGGGDDDTLIGDKGDDVKVGGEGDDLIIWNDGDGSDRIDGGEGLDTVQVNGSARSGDEFRIETLGEVGSDQGNRVFFERTNLGLFNLNIDTVETLEVNSFDGDDSFTVDDLTQTTLERIEFNAGGGDDSLNASLTSTTIVANGDAGDDRIVSGSADDTLQGGIGNDFLSGGGGADLLLGEKGDDTLRGGNGSDTTDGGEGNDTADFSDIPFSISADLLQGTASYEVPSGAVIIDTLISIENLLGSQLDDDLRGDRKSNTIQGDDGDDLLIGRRGLDTLLGGNGDDTLRGGLDNDRLNGDAGNDVILGGRGKDTINGGVGNDVLLGGGNADTFVFDAALLDGQTDVDQIRGFQSIDRLDFSEYLNAGGTISVGRVSARLLQIDLSGEDTVNVFGSRTALNTAETQLSEIL